MADTSRCINCSMRLAHQRWRTLQDATEPMVNILRGWISPTPVSPENRLCFECFGMLQGVPDGVVTVPQPMFGHRSVCFACGRSTLRTHTRLVHLDCPERNIINRWILPHLAPHLTRVCLACWMAARRDVQRQVQQDAGRPIEALNADTEDGASHVPVPPPQPPIIVPQPRIQRVTVTSHTYSRAISSSRHCMFSGCENVERLLVPASSKEMLLRQYNFYVPPSARICRYHLENDCWDQLRSDTRDFTATQMDQMLNMMKRVSLKTVDFSNINMMPPHLCHYYLGMTAAQFHELLSEIPSLSEEVPSASVALSIYLVKLRTGDSNERLSTLFEMSRTTLERYMKKARNCMSQRLAPQYLGIDHMSVEEVASESESESEISLFK